MMITSFVIIIIKVILSLTLLFKYSPAKQNTNASRFVPAKKKIDLTICSTASDVSIAYTQKK